MTQSDYNIINPVQNLPNVTGVNPAKDSDRRSKKRNAPKRPQPKTDFAEEEQNELAADNADNNLSTNDTDEHQIDYRA